MHDPECKDSLEGLDHHADPTWGYYVYGIYTRPQGQDNDDSNTQKAAGKLLHHTLGNQFLIE